MRRVSTRAMTLVATSLVLVGPGNHALAVPPPPKPFLVMVQDDGVGNCVMLIYSDLPAAPLNQSVTWDDTFPGTVTVNEVNGFWTFQISFGGNVYRNVTEAGTFSQECGGAVTGLPVSVKAPASTSDPTFQVRWATPFTSPSSDVYSVQYKMGLSGTVKTWRSKNAQKAAIFPGQHGHAYFFRAMSFIDDTHHSGWSQWKRTVVH